MPARREVMNYEHVQKDIYLLAKGFDHFSTAGVGSVSRRVPSVDQGCLSRVFDSFLVGSASHFSIAYRQFTTEICC